MGSPARAARSLDQVRDRFCNRCFGADRARRRAFGSGARLISFGEQVGVPTCPAGKSTTALRSPLALFIAHKAPALRRHISPFDCAIGRDAKEDIGVFRVPFANHGAAVGKLDDARPFGRLGIFDSDAAAGKSMAMRKREAHSSRPRHRNLSGQHIAPGLDFLRVFGRFSKYPCGAVEERT